MRLIKPAGYQGFLRQDGKGAQCPLLHQAELGQGAGREEADGAWMDYL